MLHFLYISTTYVVLGVVLLAGYPVYCAALPRPIAGIPYHKSSATRVLGDAPAMIKHTRQYGTVFDWMAEQAVALNSPIFQLFLKPFSKPVVFITDPREAQDILLRRTKDFDRSRFFQDVFGGTVPHCHVIQPTNDKFRQGRRLLADTMATPFLNTVAAPLLHRHTLNLMELWRVKNNAAAGHAFWVADDLNYFALDSIWDVAFGSQLNSLPEEAAFLKSISKFNISTSRDNPVDLPKPKANAAVNSMRILTHGLDVAVTSPTPSLSHWLLSLTPSYRRARSYKERLVQERLDDAKARLLDRITADDLEGITCATDHMVRRESQAANKENRAPNYESRQAKDELFGFLVGGYDTTATTLMWSTKFMTDNQRVQSKLRAVLFDTFGGGEDNGGAPPTPGQITATRIPYLDAVIEEIVRCAQTASSATRMTLRDTQLLGHHIPKGVDVFMLSNGPGYMAPNDLNETIPEHARSPSSQESKGRAIPSWASSNIAAFRPERWIKTDKEGVETFDMRAGPSMQFGSGLRGCFGKKLAYLEIRILITLLLWTFELQPVPESLKGHEAFDSLTHKPKKCYLKLKEPGRTAAN
ncbi:cytochrome P450 [Hypoxylon rubiginosum]|uniref:Cytochrome P450 n=1 Tax=Hypoxylon rubiginosum TaxID=110542 RepID=A0ACB9ZJP7_9PEZI|nr:cytochrome P450 [Hypoxylon rubiginosum]